MMRLKKINIFIAIGLSVFVSTGCSSKSETQEQKEQYAKTEKELAVLKLRDRYIDSIIPESTYGSLIINTRQRNKIDCKIDDLESKNDLKKFESCIVDQLKQLPISTSNLDLVYRNKTIQEAKINNLKIQEIIKKAKLKNDFSIYDVILIYEEAYKNKQQ